MKPFRAFPLAPTKAFYKGQKVMSQLKALRTNEIKHRMCLEARNLADHLYNKYKIAGMLTRKEYTLLLNMYYTYVLTDRVDTVRHT